MSLGRLLGVGLVVVTLTAAAAAQHAAKEPNDAKAAAHYKQGRAFFKAEVWDKALEEYKAAYQLSPRPLLLYHMGTAYEKLGDKASALEHYKRFLDKSPEGEGADQARMRVAILTKELQTEKPAPATSPAGPPPVTRDPAPPPTVPAYVGPTDPYQAETSRAKWIWIGAGAAAIAGGVALDLIPDSGRDYQLEAVDFIPIALYAAGAAAITIGLWP